MSKKDNINIKENNEQNSKKETVETEDIFSEMCTEVNTSDEEDINIF